MIQITGIRRLNPYRRKSTIADFLQCPICLQIYQPAIRLAICPHPIVAPERLFPADTRLVVSKRKPKAKRGPRILQSGNGLNYWDPQPGEHPKRYQAFKLWLDLNEKRTFAAVARGLGKSGTLIEGWAKEDKWVIRLEALEHHRAVERRKAEQKILERDVSDMLKINRARFRMLANEAARRLRLVESKKAEPMTEAEFDRAFEASVKVHRLLHDQSTEIIKHESPDLIRERQIREIVALIQDAVELKRKSGAAEDDVAACQWRYTQMAAAKFDLPVGLVAQAVSGLDQESESVS